MAKARTPEDVYKLELKKILSNYGSYIQKINNGFNLDKYEVIEIDKFNDILEIRETIQEPILGRLGKVISVFSSIPINNLREIAPIPSEEVFF